MSFNPFEIFGPAVIIMVPAFAAAVAFSVVGVVILVEKMINR